MTNTELDVIDIVDKLIHAITRRHIPDYPEVKDAVQALNQLIAEQVEQGCLQHQSTPKALGHEADNRIEMFALAERHLNKLRHCVNVGHWDSKCGNCNTSLFSNMSKEGKLNCPTCKFYIDAWTTDYAQDNLETYQAVFPDLPYYNMYEVFTKGIDLAKNSPETKADHQESAQVCPTSHPAAA